MQQCVFTGESGGRAFQRFELVVEQPAQQSGLGLRQEGESGAPVGRVEYAESNPFMGVGSRALIGGRMAGRTGKPLSSMSQIPSVGAVRQRSSVFR